jgi:hypothetical protein
MRISEAFAPRSIDSLGIWDVLDWRLKVYTIAYGQVAVDSDLIEAARVVTRERIGAARNRQDHYEVGFVGIHQGKTGNFVFVDWWAHENELYHHVYTSTSREPTALRYMTPTGLTACVWDIQLIGFERDAWVEHVLRKDEAPDVEGYLRAKAGS